MNNHDLNNLNYILSLSKDDLLTWYVTLSNDDIAYAMEIMQQYQTTVALEALEFQDFVDDLTDANFVIDSIKNKGKQRNAN